MSTKKDVQCLCTECKQRDVIQEVGSWNWARFVVIFEMFKDLDWLYGKGKGLGSNLKFVEYKRKNENDAPKFNYRLEKKVKAIHKDDGTLYYDRKDKTKASLSKILKLYNEYYILRKKYNKAKYFINNYDTQEVVHLGLTSLVCECGNDNIIILSNNTHLQHLGINSSIVYYELKDYETEHFDGLDVPEWKIVLNGLYIEKGYDTSIDSVLNAETKRECYDSKVYEHILHVHELEDKFYTLAHLGELMVYRILGKNDSELIRDIITEHYSVKRSR